MEWSNDFFNIFSPKFSDHPYGINNKENACTWNNSLQSETSIDSPFSSFLFSPPQSVKSIDSNDDQCAKSLTYDDFETSYVYNNENSLPPMKNSQGIAYPTGLDFNEIEDIALSGYITYNNEHVKTGDEPAKELEKPIFGDDLMFGQLSNSQIISSNAYLNIDEEKMDTTEMETADENANIIPPQNILPITKVLRAKNERPTLKLIMPMQQSDSFSNMAFKATEVISTPQVTDEILDLEQDFDLINYIDSNQVTKFKFFDCIC